MAGAISGTNIRADLEEALCDGETQGGGLAYDYLLDWLEAIVHSYQERAYAAGRAAGLGEAKERLNAMADDYSVQADKALDSYGPVPYYTCLDKANALREGASAIEALAGGGKNV